MQLQRNREIWALKGKNTVSKEASRVDKGRITDAEKSEKIWGLERAAPPESLEQGP